MPDKAVISHRGEKYEIGRGKRFYGIWVLGAPYEAPVDRWPENRDGWQQAWSRFASMEASGTISEVDPGEEEAGAGGHRAQAAAAPPRRRGAPGRGGPAGAGRGARAGRVVPRPTRAARACSRSGTRWCRTCCYVIGWMVTAGLVALSVARPSNAARLGALFGLGLSAVTFGLFLADLGQATSGQASAGLGLVVSLLGWVACTAGAALALRRGPRATRASSPGWRRRPRWAHAGASGAAGARRDRHRGRLRPVLGQLHARRRHAGTSQTITAGNAFDNPGLVIAGNVLVMVAVVAGGRRSRPCGGHPGRGRCCSPGRSCRSRREVIPP